MALHQLGLSPERTFRVPLGGSARMFMAGCPHPEVGANYLPLPGGDLPLPGGDLPLQGSSWVFDPKVANSDIALAACFVIRCACR